MPTTTRITLTIRAQHIDSWDEDTAPETLPVHGNITLTPVLKPGEPIRLMDNGQPVTLVPLPIQARISDGTIFHRGANYIEILTGGDQLTPTPLQWKAEFHGLQSDGKPIKLNPITFTPTGDTCDLTTAAAGWKD